MDPRIFHIFHVLSVIVLVGTTFAAFANPTELVRRKVLSASGVASLIAVISGFGLAGLLKVGFPLWLIVKIVCWLGLSAIAGITFRQPKKIPALAALTVAMVLIALVMIYFRPFQG